MIKNPRNSIKRVPKRKQSDIDSRFYALPSLDEARGAFARTRLADFIAEGKEDSVAEIYQRAEELYGLQKYAEAAELYERGFEAVQPGGAEPSNSRSMIFASKLAAIYDRLNMPERAQKYLDLLKQEQR